VSSLARILTSNRFAHSSFGHRVGAEQGGSPGSEGSIGEADDGGPEPLRVCSERALAPELFPANSCV
jgi:hypothetical protein